MNHSSPGSAHILSTLSLSRAVDGFIKYKLAEGLSQRTVTSYEYILSRWAAYCEDVPVNQIDSSIITGYLAWLRTDYKPVRYNGSTHPLSKKTIRNVWVALKAFWNWACQEFKLPDPMEGINAPRYQKPEIETLTRDEIEKLLKACKESREAKTELRRKFTMRRPSASRDQAILLILLDTGLRATELCTLKIGDVDQKTGRVQVRHGDEGGAKYGKGRTVFLGKASRRALWRYLAAREDGEDPDAPLIIASGDRPFNKDSLRVLIKRLASRAGVKGVYPHKFRHTFAITYLRSGGDVFTLQVLLGHSSLDMVKHYARVAEVDVQDAHRKASPADNWRL
jgi:integrase/recombinase XerD